MTFAQGWYLLAYLREAGDMHRKRTTQCSSDIASGISVLSESHRCDTALDISSKICTTSVAERSIGSVVNLHPLAELHLTAIVETWDATEGEHEIEIFSPLVGATVKSYAIIRSWGIIVGIYIHHIICGVVVEVIAVEESPYVSH